MSKPSYKQARKARGTAEMTIESAPKTFTDKNLDPKSEPAEGNSITKENAPEGGSISLMPNAPKQTSRGSGSTKPDSEGLTKA